MQLHPGRVGDRSTKHRHPLAQNYFCDNTANVASLCVLSMPRTSWHELRHIAKEQVCEQSNGNFLKEQSLR